MFKPEQIGSEGVNLSDGTSGAKGTRAYAPHIYDISAQIKLNDKSVVPTNIGIGGLTLENIEFTGETNHIVINDGVSKTGQVGNAKDNASVVYSLSEFNAITDAIAKSSGYADAAAARTAGLKKQMTKQELMDFVNNGTTNIKRKMI